MNPVQRVAGRYELDDLPIRGAMGQVFTAYDPCLDRRVAIKRMHPDLMADPELVKRFRREARLTGRVNHPGIPTVLDYGTDEHGPYLVMEYVDGHTLQDLIREISPLSTAWVAAIGAQICAILDHTHAASLIHRDLKPNNILLGPDGRVTIVDFGVSVLVGASRLSTLTGSGRVLGAPEYQAPERRLGVESPLTDLYAVGRVLHHLSSRIAPPGNPAIAALVGELTTPFPQDRPQRARDVVDRLLPLVGHLESLPGFVSDVSTVASHVSADTAIPVSSATGVASTTLADLPHLRRRAERYAAGGRLQQAIDLLDYLVTIATEAGEPTALDLRWDRARWLFETGNSARLAVELADLAAQLSDRLGTEHPVVASARLMLAQVLASRGQVRHSITILEDLIAALAAAYGPRDPRLYPARLELGIQLAVAGDVAKGSEVLRALTDDQRDHLGPHHPDLTITLDVLSAV